MSVRISNLRLKKPCCFIVQVEDVIKRWPGVRKISFVAHSLGGLVARYAIGRLYEPPVQTEVAGLNRSCLVREENVSDQCHKQSSEETVAGLEPVNFITVATPHLGSRGHKQVCHYLIFSSLVDFFSYFSNCYLLFELHCSHSTSNA